MKILGWTFGLGLVVAAAIWWLLPERGGFLSQAHPPAAKPAEQMGAGEVLQHPRVVKKAGGTAGDPILSTPYVASRAHCVLAPWEEQTVASPADAQILEIPVRLGDVVKVDDRLAQLDAGKLIPQIQILEVRAASTAAENIAKALYDEAEARVRYAKKANEKNGKAVPEIEEQTYLAQRDRYMFEIKKAREERMTAQKELEKARMNLQSYTVRSSLAGEVVKIYKRNGETVRQADPLFRITRLDKLRIEGLCTVQNAEGLSVGKKILVEPEIPGSLLFELVGHTASIADLHLFHDGQTIASASDDGECILWDLRSKRSIATVSSPSPVHSVRILASSGDSFTLASGCEDGVIRIWTVSKESDVSNVARELKGHDGPVRCLVVDPDNAMLFSGGQDRRIGRWDWKAGKHVAWIHGIGAFKQSAHHGAVTDLHCTSEGVLISAGHDQGLRVWQPAGATYSLAKTYRGRTGDVQRLSLAGNTVLFDHGDEIRFLDKLSGQVVGMLRNGRGARLKDVVLASNSGRLVLAGTADGLVRLWRSPLDTAVIAGLDPSSAGMELRHYRLPKSVSLRCATFSADETCFLTAGADRVIRAWAVPDRSEWRLRTATIVYVGSEIENTTDMVRIVAELPNQTPGTAALRPGGFVNLKVAPPH